ncbi:MAG: thrombospondin type-1 domain-containing protein, partial [Chitinophagales bacterium]|nr:thrombospondin type-1 domain-containing protein [Chitinophagales bacterium]
MLRASIVAAFLLCTSTTFANFSLTGPCFDNVIVSVVNESCEYDFNFDGEIKVTPVSSFHNGPYNYAWSDGQTTSLAIALDAGTYMVTITDKTHFCDTSFSVTVGQDPDTTKPDCFSQSINVSLDSLTEEVSINASSLDAGSSDDCSPYVGYSASQTTFTCADLPSQTVTLTVTDAAGNSNSCLAQVNVSDPDATCESCTNPTISIIETQPTCPDSANGALEAVVTGSSTYSYQWNAPAGSQTTSKATGLTAGTYVVTVTDESNPSCSVVGFESLDDADDTPPEITCWSDTSIICNSIFLLPFPDVTDACGIDSVTIDVDSAVLGPCPIRLTAYFVFIAYDKSGKTDTCRQVIIVMDTTSPTLIIPMDIMISCDADTSADSLGVATAFDTCLFSIDTLSVSYYDTLANDTTIHRIWSSSDICGNTTYGLQIITLKGCIDSVDCVVGPWSPWSACDTSCGGGMKTRTRDILVYPSNGGLACPDTIEMMACNTQACQDSFDLICPGNVIVKTDPNKCFATVSGVIAERLDTAANDTIYHYALGDSGGADASGKYPVGTTEITFIYENLKTGEKDTCKTLVTVNDNQAPSVFCIQDVGAPLDPISGEVTVPVAAVHNNSFDNCGIDTLYMSQDKFDCSDVGFVSVTLTAMDLSGNINNCVTQIDVQDNTDPEAVCNNIAVFVDTNGMAVIYAAMIDG